MSSQVPNVMYVLEVIMTDKSDPTDVQRYIKKYTSKLAFYKALNDAQENVKDSALGLVLWDDYVTYRTYEYTGKETFL